MLVSVPASFLQLAGLGAAKVEIWAK